MVVVIVTASRPSLFSDVVFVCLNLSFPTEHIGMFSAPTFGDSSERALLKPPENPSLDFFADLNRWDPFEPSPKSALGEGSGEESAGVGEWAKARGGDEERSTMVDILGGLVIAHRDRLRSANAMGALHGEAGVVHECFLMSPSP